MTNVALFLLPVLFLGGICGVLHSLSRRAAPLPPLPSLEERRTGGPVVPAQNRRRSASQSAPPPAPWPPAPAGTRGAPAPKAVLKPLRKS